jgi:tRNA-dihydrouridine synthase 2
MQRKARVEALFGTKDNPALILAPMVRAGTLPLRLLALHYGARTTFSEELIAKKLMGCVRVENKTMGTIDFVSNSHHNRDTLVYQTCPLEAGRNILQIGASNAAEAVQAARLVANDVSGIDLNCGCPIAFSVKGGMGAALLKKPCVTAEIVRSLREAMPEEVTVSCKIRLLETEKDTIDLIKAIEKAGVDAITIHCRRVEERPRDPARWEELENIIKACSVPVVVNGDVYTMSDCEKILAVAPSAVGVMIARGAISDPSAAFCGQAVTVANTLDQYLAVAELCSPNYPNTKWFASQVIRYRKNEQEFHRKIVNDKISRAKSTEDLMEAFGIDRARMKNQSCWASIEAEKSSTMGWRDAFNSAISICMLHSEGERRGDLENDAKRLKVQTDS